MNFITFFFIFFLIWWMVFHMALTVGIKTDDIIIPGNASSAPDKPHLGIKAAISTIIALLLTILLFVVVHYDLIDFSGITSGK